MVTISPQAEIAIRSLLPPDKKRVERQLAILDHFPDDAPDNVKRLSGSDKLYIVRATGALRILFRRTGQTIEVMDVFTRDRLEQMHEHAG